MSEKMGIVAHGDERERETGSLVAREILPLKRSLTKPISANKLVPLCSYYYWLFFSLCFFFCLWVYFLGKFYSTCQLQWGPVSTKKYSDPDSITITKWFFYKYVWLSTYLLFIKIFINIVFVWSVFFLHNLMSSKSIMYLEFFFVNNNLF